MTKSKIYLYFAIAVVVFTCTIILLLLLLRRSNEQYKDVVMNEKTLLMMSDSVKTQNRVLELSMSKLKYTKDSLVTDLMEMQHELGIKDKKIEQLMNVSSELKHSDTLFLHDTTILDDDAVFVLDTMMGDNWVQNIVHLELPGYIAITTKAESEKMVILSLQKETVNPPKKFFLARWLQKKYKYIKADIRDKNPYITEKKNIFIQTVK